MFHYAKMLLHLRNFVRLDKASHYIFNMIRTTSIPLPFYMTPGLMITFRCSLRRPIFEHTRSRKWRCCFPRWTSSRASRSSKMNLKTCSIKTTSTRTTWYFTMQSRWNCSRRWRCCIGHLRRWGWVKNNEDRAYYITPSTPHNPSITASDSPPTISHA